MPAVTISTQERGELEERLSRRVIPGLDGLRALAVLLVIGHHLGVAVINGSLGVMMFFVLSGFLITWILLQESERSGTVSLKRFYRRRSLRLFPALIVFTAAALLVPLLRGNEPQWVPALASMLYISNYFFALHHHGESDFGHTWSLSIEEQFYLLWPVLFLLGKNNLRRLAGILFAVVGAVWLYRAALFLFFGVRTEYLYRAFETRMDHLAVGCLLAVVLHRGYLQRWVNLVCGRSWLPAVTLALIFGSQLLHDDPA